VSTFDDVPPWEKPQPEVPVWGIPDSLLREIEEFPARQRAKVDAVLAAPYVASEHLPVWDYIEDEDAERTFMGCRCEIPTVREPDDWGPHVDELQRRDRFAVWAEAISYAERGGEPHGMPWRNPYEKES
jgi:hypothetical protein